MSERRVEILREDFFARPAEVVARDLLCIRLVRRIGREVKSAAIVETEAYLGPHDLACHAARGRTKRNEAMFGPPGTLYIYLVYGLHWMLNIVTDRPGYPAAVLIRGIEGISGPGRLCSALGIDGSLNGLPAGRKTGLWFEMSCDQPVTQRVLKTPRIGIDYSGPLWSAKKLRFLLERASPRRRRSPS